jgi:hypothetical protein
MSVNISIVVFYEKNKHLFGTSLDWLNDDIRVVFLATATGMDPADHDTYSDITSGAVSTPAALDNKTATADGTTGEGVLDADNESGITPSGEWRYIVIMQYDSGTPGNSKLIYYGDAGSGQVVATYNLVWSADGLIRIV